MGILVVRILVLGILFGNSRISYYVIPQLDWRISIWNSSLRNSSLRNSSLRNSRFRNSSLRNSRIP
ncbi:pentapeptide repeat-containing protein [Campylobacter magnus]|uniref:pentapeptide repeat-containing protein n=1 Tax=Campylobacter magnus TaxID=3026462 RepID=UPI00345DE56B